jgi:hypothetical protein
MIALYDANSGQEIGTITEAQLEFLRAQLEEESATDQDYYIDRNTLDMFEDEGADGALLALLQRALGARGEMDIRWEHR